VNPVRACERITCVSTLASIQSCFSWALATPQFRERVVVFAMHARRRLQPSSAAEPTLADLLDHEGLGPGAGRAELAGRRLPGAEQARAQDDRKPAPASHGVMLTRKGRRRSSNNALAFRACAI
jgi:hypothetical protein